jgi:SAM-dependent methyltransferase
LRRRRGEADDATLHALCRRGDELFARFRAERGDEFSSFVPADHAGACAMLRELRPRADSFLELGSGAGVVTIAADLLGYDAYGIEIEPRLCDYARDLADEFGSDARFAVGSFLPDDFDAAAVLADADFHVTLDGTPAYDELGVGLADFDLVYAFPWPGEEELFVRLVREHGRRGTLLLTYDASEGFTVHER